MKRLIKIFLLSLCLVLVSCGKEVSVEQARQALSKHLVERYGEEFEIGYMGRRSDGKESWYQAEIYPSKYIGTPREYDKYYHRFGTVDIKKGILGEEIEFVGDTYRIVLMNESANEFYLPKLKELFWENVLPVLEIDIARLSVYPDFITELQKGLSAGERPKIKGGIYIFGRVENDEDRERYRSEIYKFIDFMKETGTFEYVDLDILIIDERILTDEFKNNTLGTLTELNKLNEEYTSEKEFLKERKKIMDKLNIYFDKNKYYKENIEKINKNILRNEGAAIYTKGNNLLYLKLYSPQYIKLQGYKKELKDYNSLEEIKFDWERWK